MTSFSNIEVRRCRPLLGTFVEIMASGLDEVELGRAIEAGFAAIEATQKLMSAHDPSSELWRVNQEAFVRPVEVSKELFEVLRRGNELARESAGGFDFTIAPLLARWGLLPSPLRRRRPGGWRDVDLQTSGRVRFTRPLAIDLGGIAKGYAVDKAVEQLRRDGVPSALVNAGGDMRAFGERFSTVHVRHPAQQRLLSRSIRIRDEALATSSPCFTETPFQGHTVSHLVNMPRGVAITGPIAVTVRACECWLADALTKVVLSRPRLAESLLVKHHAEGFVFTA